MLVTIPKSLEGMNSSEKYLLKKLKSLYILEPSLAFLYLEPKVDNLNPDFILIDPKRGVVILEVKAWSIEFLASVNSKFVTTINNQEIENPLSKARRYFNSLKNLLRKNRKLLDEKGELSFLLKSKVVFTELLKEDIKPFKEQFTHYPAEAIYKEELKNLSFEKLFGKNIKAINPEILDELRASIFPEIKLKKENLTITLDYEQERFAKSLPLGHYMITGVPGSGKSVTLISRAIYLSKLNPKWKILVVVYNKLLKSTISQTLKETKIEVKTFHQLALSISNYNQSLKGKDDNFWNEELPFLALKSAKRSFDAILVDEYQDFHKSWFELLIKLLKPIKKEQKEYLNLFLAGDRLQSIYHPKEINWKRDIGLDMRGRSKLLKVSYRIAPEQLRLALKILMRDKRYKKEVEEFYEGLEGIKFKNSLSNSIELIDGGYSLIVDRVLEILGEFGVEDILILALRKSSLEKLKRYFPKEILKKISISKEFKKDKITLSTLHSSKGIEAEVVILIDIDKIEDRKLFYVGATRAKKRLILHSFDFESSEISTDVLNLLKE